MALSIVREVNRSIGLSLASGATIISGQPLMLVPTASGTATQVKPFDGSVTNSKPYGLALEDSQFLPLQNASAPDQTAGQGYDYTNFARGGLYSALLDGGEVQLFSDGRGYPFLQTDTWFIGAPVYANSSGLITATAGSNPLIGYCTGFTGSPATMLQVKIVI
jgi:hypothetical protein